MVHVFIGKRVMGKNENSGEQKNVKKRMTKGSKIENTQKKNN